MTDTNRLPLECTVLFADLANSTQLYARVGDAVAFGLVDGCLRAARTEIEQRGGRVVKHTGDGLMAVFPEPDRAADAAVRIQKVVRELPRSSGQTLALRIGFQCGPVVESGLDVFGETVNVAARLGELASPGRALTSFDTARRLAPEWQALLHVLPARTLRGVPRPVTVVELHCEVVGDATQVQTVQLEVEDEPELRLYQGTQAVVLGAARSGASLGRESSSDLRVTDKRASRQHADVELRGDKFVLTDHSSNGTFVAIEGEKEFVLFREEVVLRGRGHIALGRSCAGNPQAIEFISM